MKICNGCKTENDDNSKFCKNCGTEMNRKIVEECEKIETYVDNIETDNIIKSKRLKINISRKMKRVIFILSLCIMLLIVAFVLWKCVFGDIVCNKILEDYRTDKITYQEAWNNLYNIGMTGVTTAGYISDCNELEYSKEAYKKATSYYNNHEYKKAISEFKKVISIDTNYGDAIEKIENSKLELSKQAYDLGVKYENNSYLYHAYESYSDVIESDDNYANAQAKIKTLKQKILESSIVQLREYKVSNDYENALDLIKKTEKYVQDATLNNYKDYFLHQQSIANIVNFEYNHGPFTLYTLYSSGKVMYTTYIETFNITEAAKMTSGDIKITCEVTGVVSGSDYCNFKIKCYNEKGFIVESVSVLESVASNEPFKIVDEVYIPADTVKIDFVAD